MSGLGLLVEALNWRHQRQIIEEVQRFQKNLWAEISEIIRRVVPRGIRTSWTGWVRQHFKVTPEREDIHRVRNVISSKIIPPRRCKFGMIIICEC